MQSFPHRARRLLPFASVLRVDRETPPFALRRCLDDRPSVKPQLARKRRQQSLRRSGAKPKGHPDRFCRRRPGARDIEVSLRISENRVSCPSRGMVDVSAESAQRGVPFFGTNKISHPEVHVFGNCSRCSWGIDRRALASRAVFLNGVCVGMQTTRFQSDSVMEGFHTVQEC